MYAMIGMRPDIAHGMSLVSRFMSNPSNDHWNTVKWLLRYLKGTINKGLVYRSNNLGGRSIRGFYDSDYVTDLDKRRSLSSYTFTLGGNLVTGSLTFSILWLYPQQKLSMWP